MKLIINESTCSNIEQKSLAEESKLITRIKETEKEIELLDSRFSTKGLIRWLMTGPRRLVRRKPEQPAASTPKMSSKMAEVQRKLREREKKQS